MLKMRRVMLLTAVVAMASNCNFFFAFAPDQICETLIRAQCRFAFNCCNASERTALLFGLGQFRNESECIEESLEEGGVCGNDRQVHDAVNQGRFQYDGALAERCLKPAIDAANSCDADAVLGDAAEHLLRRAEVFAREDPFGRGVGRQEGAPGGRCRRVPLGCHESVLSWEPRREGC
jgi:hypothetical protein